MPHRLSPTLAALVVLIVPGSALAQKPSTSQGPPAVYPRVSVTTWYQVDPTWPKTPEAMDGNHVPGIAVGPDAADRILALDTMVINVIALLVLYGVWRGTEIYFEAAMLVAMVGFVSTVAYCRFILRGDIIE